MTLSEKIEYERAIAEANRKVAEFEPIDDVDSCIVANCIKFAEEHEQYASWLEELSRRRVEELFRKTNEKAIRDKAIDDFAILMKETLNHDWATTKISEQIIYNRLFDKCNEIAEQLKEGGADETVL